MQALNAISGFASEDAQFHSAQLVPATSQDQPLARASLDLSDATEFAAPLRQLLAGSTDLPAVTEPSHWTGVSAMAVIEAAASEMAHMGQARFDGALTASLTALRVGGEGVAGAAAAAMEPGGTLRSLSAWLEATFSPGMRQAAAEVFTEPAERAATYKRRFRQPCLSDPPSQTPPSLRSQSRLAQPASSPISPGGAVHAAVDMAAVQSDGSSSYVISRHFEYTSKRARFKAL